MGQKFRNNFTTTLTGTITASSTELSLTAAPTPTITLTLSDDHFLLTIVNASGAKEVVKCVGISGLTVTIGTALGTPSTAGRAQENTTALAITHTDDHVIGMRSTRGTLENILTNIDTLEADTAVASESQAGNGADNTQPLSSLRGRQMMDGYAPIASESQSTTGTNNTARMTPLRTAQAITAQTELSNDSTPSLAGDLTQGDHITYLNSSPADGEASGTGFTGIVDVNAQGFAAPLFCAADGNYETCDADLEGSMPCRCLALESGTGAGKKLLLKGFIRNNAWNWTLIGKNIYISTSTGALTQTLVTGTADQAQVVGYAITADIMYFKPNDIMVEIV